jgi:hypothetical protein
MLRGRARRDRRARARLDLSSGVVVMMDLAFVSLTLALAALTWGFVRLCERVR